MWIWNRSGKLELPDIKKEVISRVISDDDGSVTSASLEDIAFVLG